MKISFLCPVAGMFGGLRVIGIHAEELGRLGHEVTVYSVLRPRPRLRTLAKDVLRGRRPRWRARAPATFLDSMDVDHVRLPHAGPIADRDLPDADVVVATWWETAHWAASLSPAKGVKAYFMQDYGAPGQELEKIAPTWRLPLAKITIAGWMKALIEAHAPGQTATVVLTAVDAAGFSAPPRGKRPVPTVGFVWRAGAAKGADLALAALALARAECPELKVVAFGERAAAGPPLPDWLTFHHRPADAALPGLYAACDAWLFPSRLEGFGLPIQEAMACRTPVISTPVGAAPELIAPDRGWLLPDFAPETMAAAILEAVRLPEPEWQARSEAARKSVEAYGWAEAGRAFEAALVAAAARDKAAVSRGE